MSVLYEFIFHLVLAKITLDTDEITLADFLDPACLSVVGSWKTVYLKNHTV